MQSVPMPERKITASCSLDSHGNSESKCLPEDTLVFNPSDASYDYLSSYCIILSILYSSGRAIDHRKIIDDFVGRHRDLRPLDLSDSDWEAIILVTGWLKSFRTATTSMSTTKRPMLSFTHAIFRGLQEDLRTSLKQLPFSTPSVLRNGLLEAHRKLSDYYYKMDQSPYYTWAAREYTFITILFHCTDCLCKFLILVSRMKD
jgi:hypothetical protein